MIEIMAFRLARRYRVQQCGMRTDGRGRPRLEQSRRPGKTARDEILDAAAELFSSLGYAGTSTRRIADAVGMRQASLYHHFATKDDILDALLAGTVDGALYLLPELRVERFEMFRLRREELRRLYRQLSAGVIAQSGGPAEADDLPFRLVESIINRRSDDGGCAPDQPWVIADGALRVLGWSGDFARVRRSTAERLGAAPVGPVAG